MKTRCLCAALLLITVAQGAHAADWPAFRGPASDGIYRGETPLGEVEDLGLVVVWKHELGSGYSGVSVASGVAVTMFSDGTDDYAVAFDAASGEELWRHRIDATNRGHDGAHDGPISTPAIHDGRVFLLGPTGPLLALDVATGTELWRTHLVHQQGSMKPMYGYGSSPLLQDGVLIVEAGARMALPGGGPPGSGGPPGANVPTGPPGGPAVLGFDPASGGVLWKVEEKDTVNYQSPVPAFVNGREVTLAATDVHLYGLAPKSGEVLWKVEHHGKFYPGPGVPSMNPVDLGDGLFFITDTPNSSSVIRLAASEDGQMGMSQVWSDRSIRGTYAIPVLLEGRLYGYSSGFLTCVEAATGKSVWRSRQPGDGFPILVDGYLAVQTKKGSLHVAPASPDGYHELAGLDLFEASWTPPSFADGRFFVRGFDAIAAVELRSGVATAAPEETTVAGARFNRFLKEVAAAQDKAKAVDDFLAAQESFPVIEETGAGSAEEPEELAVDFLFRGDAEDMGIGGDMVGDRAIAPMTRIEGTDLFFYSTTLLRDARVSYYFVKDFEERLTDPRNPRRDRDMEGEVSWVGLPGFRPPTHLREPPADRRGRLETLEVKTSHFPAPRKIDVYLPAGYDSSKERRYPVAYVHGGNLALAAGLWTRSLDNLIGTTVEPLIVAFIHTSGPREMFRQTEAYAAMFAEEIVPAVDGKYRTRAEPESRASVGAGLPGFVALFSALRHPGIVGRVASQSTFLLTAQTEALSGLVKADKEHPVPVYLEWGAYDSRAEQEAWDIRVENRKLAELLRSLGYEVTAGEVADGSGWAAWRNRTDKILEWLYPLVP